MIDKKCAFRDDIIEKLEALIEIVKDGPKEVAVENKTSNIVDAQDTKGSITDDQKTEILGILDKYDFTLNELTSHAFDGSGYYVEYINDLTYNQADYIIDYAPSKPFYFE